MLVGSLGLISMASELVPGRTSPVMLKLNRV